MLWRLFLLKMLWQFAIAGTFTTSAQTFYPLSQTVRQIRAEEAFAFRRIQFKQFHK
jgi:ATP/ADP translocase